MAQHATRPKRAKQLRPAVGLVRADDAVTHAAGLSVRIDLGPADVAAPAAIATVRLNVQPADAAATSGLAHGRSSNSEHLSIGSAPAAHANQQLLDAPACPVSVKPDLDTGSASSCSLICDCGLTAGPDAHAARLGATATATRGLPAAAPATGSDLGPADSVDSVKAPAVGLG